MQYFTLGDVIDATNGQLLSGDLNKVIKNVSTDSRGLDCDTLFVPLKGEHSDGHDFLDSATIAITQVPKEKKDGVHMVLVENTLDAFGKIAKLYKSKYPIETVSVVGSVGKTTTRDIIYSVLSTEKNVLKTKKNFNNEIGVPIMVLSLEKEHDMAVLELGMSGLGEISRLSDIVRPNVLVMTNIGTSHIEKLGSQENIFKAKMEAVEHFDSDNTVIANKDDKFLCTVPQYGDYKVMFYSLSDKNADAYADNVVNLGEDGIEFDIVYKNHAYPAKLNIIGEHNIYNALAGFLVGIAEGIEIEDIIEGIKNVSLTSMRMEVVEWDGKKIINDCYNAAPNSMIAALSALESIPGKRHVAILGDVLEMGEYAKASLLEVGGVAAKKCDILICAGDNAKYIAKGAKDSGLENVVIYDSTDMCVGHICSLSQKDDVILIKASRGMHFEKIFNKLTEGRSL